VKKNSTTSSRDTGSCGAGTLRRMGLDALYQAIPHDSPILTLGATNSLVGDWLGLVPRWLSGSGLSPGPPEPEEQQLFRLSEDLLRSDPSIAHRSCDVGRSWDKIHYLLSAHRRGEAGTEVDTLCDFAVRGEAALGQNITSSQGPVRYTRPATVVRIADVLSSRPPESLRRHLNAERMEQAGVYKFGAFDATDDGWRLLLEAYCELRALYRGAATHREGVLAFML